MEPAETQEIPQVETHAFFLVFATYGQTMGYVQSFESLMKVIVCLYNFFEKDKAGAIGNEEFEEIFSEHDRSPLGKVLKGLEDHMGMVEDSVKETAIEHLSKIRDARNDLAHSYLVRKEPFLKHPQGRELVIAQLRNYSACFKSAILQFRQMLNHLLDSFIGPKQFREAMEQLWSEALGDAMESTGLRYFREKLKADGVI